MNFANGGGDVVGNFGISSQVLDADGLRLRIRVNPPVLGEFLVDLMDTQLVLHDDRGEPLPFWVVPA